MPEQSVETLLASIWNRREAGIKLPIDIDLTRPISHDDVEYVCNYSYPYLQIINVEATLSSDVAPKFNALPNGWVVYDYDQALCTSYSCKQYFKYHRIEDMEESDDGEGGEGGGTIVKQQFDTAYEMLKEAQTKGWAAVEIIAGNKLMQFYAWVAAQELGISLYGFVPTSEQYRQYQRINRERIEKGFTPRTSAPAFEGNSGPE